MATNKTLGAKFSLVVMAQDGENAVRYKLEVTGTRWYDTASAMSGYSVSGSTTETKKSYERGLTLLAFDSDGSLDTMEKFDTYGDATKCDDIVTELQSMHDASLVVALFSHDAISMTEVLQTELQNFGNGEIFVTEKTRTAYVFIGQYGLQKGTAYYAHDTDADITLQASVVAGVLTPRGDTGDTGADAITMDLDNGMDSVPCDSDGVVTDDVDIVTNATLYKGGEAITSGVSVAVAVMTDSEYGDITPNGTPAYADGKAEIVWTFDAGKTISGSTLATTINLTYDGVTYTKTMTINVVKSGEPGVSPTMYQVKPSLTAISFARASDGTTLTPSSVSVTCGYSKTTGDNVTTVADATGVIDNIYRLWKRYVQASTGTAGAWQKYSDDTAAPAKTIQSSYAYSAVEFCIAPDGDTLTDSTTILDLESVPVVKSGDKGAAGYNTAIVYLYKRSVTAITAIDWTNALTYSFADKKLTSTPDGWSQTIPATDGNPLYVTAATAYSNTSTDTIDASDWAAPVKYVEDGAQGSAGLNSATVKLYQRGASEPSMPTVALTYTFATGVLSGSLGDWSQTMPATDGNPCWEIVATAISSDTTDTITNSEWTGPTKVVEDGEPGDDAIVLETSPAAVVWNEEGDVTVDSSGNVSGNPTWPNQYIQVMVREGQTDVTSSWSLSYSKVTGSYSVQVGTGTTDSTFSASSSGKVIQLSAPVKETDATSLWTNGEIHITLKRTGYADLETDIPIALNALGTWKQDVINDTATAVSNKTYTWYDADGTSHESNLSTAISQSSGGLKAVAQKTTDNASSISTLEQTAEDIKSTVSDNTGRLSTLEQTADSISLKVGSLTASSVNLLSMGSTGTIAYTSSGGYFALPRTVQLTAGTTYTVTWKGYVSSSSGGQCIRLANGTDTYYGYSGTAKSSASSAMGGSTTEAVHSFTVIPASSGAYTLSLYNYSGYTSYLTWMRVDKGDWTEDGFDGWTPSENDVNAINLLPDHLLESSTVEESDGMGERKLVSSQTPSTETGTKNTNVITDSSAASSATVQSISDVMTITAKTDAEPGYVRFARSSGYGYYTSTYGSSSATSMNIYDGMLWFIPYRGAGTYKLSASFKANHPTTFTPSDGNAITIEIHPADANKTRIHYGGSVTYGQNSNDYGYVHRENSLTFGDTELNSAGTAVDVAYLEVRLFMTCNGDMSASRICVCKSDTAAAVYNTQELSDARKNEATQLATGLDIYNRKIAATADRFEWRDNSGNKMAYFDADEGAVFGGTVKAKNFYRKVCVWGAKDGGRVFWIPESATYLTEDEYEAYAGDETPLECTGSADLVLLPLVDSNPQEVRYVKLPRAQDFLGKMVEIYDLAYSEGAINGNIVVSVVNESYISNHAFADSYGLKSSTEQTSVTTSRSQVTLAGAFGKSYRFFSVEYSGNYYWLVMQ